MENATDALHMAFGVLVFVIAISITMSSFAMVRAAGTSIVESKDRENDATYIEFNSDDTQRIVGKETVIPALYRAYKENYVVRFFDRDGNTPLYVYQIKQQDPNNPNKQEFVKTNTIDLQQSSIGSHSDANALVEAILRWQQ